MSEWVNPYEVYEREPIRFHHNTIGLLQIFRVKENIQDIWAWDYTDRHDAYERAAKQFVDQLEGHACIAFYEALRDELNKHIAEHVAKGGKLAGDYKNAD